MIRLSEPVTRRVDTAQRLLGLATLTVMPLGLVADEVIQFVAHRRTTVLLVFLSVFFAMLLLRLALKALITPGRRVTLLVLMAAIALWAGGSTSVNAARIDGEVEFPAPGEWMFLLSYVAMAGFLLLDVDRRTQRPARAWLDIAVISGGTFCLASLLLVTPIQSASGLTGISLLLALIYPLADLVLALVVLGQAILVVRTDRTKSLMMGAGFLLWAGADSSFALQLSAATYDFNNLANVLWGGAFLLLVAAACRPENTVMTAVPRSAGTAVLVGAGIAALGVLTFRPDDTLIYYTLPPALVTMVAVAGRMALALRDANRASEAFALSETDDLTKLPNRRAVRTWLTESLDRREPLTLMLLDLDRFKEINDSLGHRAGDTVLTLVALRITDAVGPDVRVARLGGDEFAILLDTTDELDLTESARGVLAEIAKPILVDGLELSPSGSIGIAVSEGGDDNSELLRRADVAMYQAKNTEVGVAVYDAELDEFSRSRLQMAEELRKAIADGQIEVWYQPQVDASTLQVAGVEALVRWNHPEQGILSPVVFLPAARRAGLMGELSHVIVLEAIRDLEERRALGIDLLVSINCAPPELLGSSFLPQFYAAIEQFGVPSDRLVLEVTEDSFIADPVHTRELLRELRSHGVQVSIDDYGTGFSSLTYLRNLPVQELKIDRSLIGNIARDERTRMIVGSTIGLAHALDMRIVAEGVENAEDLAVLVSMGIDTLQGYHLARPMAAGQLNDWVRSWSFADTRTEPQPDDPSPTTDHDRLESR